MFEKYTIKYGWIHHRRYSWMPAAFLWNNDIELFVNIDGSPINPNNKLSSDLIGAIDALPQVPLTEEQYGVIYNGKDAELVIYQPVTLLFYHNEMNSEYEFYKQSIKDLL